MNLSRKQLLAAGAGAALFPGALGCAVPPQVNRDSGPSSTAFHFDEARFNQILAKPAQHRQCCASARIASGIVLDAMTATMYAYEFDLGEGPGTVHEVGVLYHPAGAMLGLNDAVWNELLVPATPRLSSHLHSELTMAGAKAHGGNPYLHRHKNTRLEDDMSIEALVSRGCDFFVCNNALLGLADGLAEALHEQSAELHARLLANLVHGAMAVPAGVMAINACQEAHFTYLQASL